MVVKQTLCVYGIQVFVIIRGFVALENKTTKIAPDLALNTRTSNSSIGNSATDQLMPQGRFLY